MSDTTDLEGLIAEVDTHILDGKATLADDPKCLALAANIRSLEKLRNNLANELGEANSESAAG
jgi:mRNA-degrading endonuclease toxin of MazEF toxin-antitoxin module